MIVNDDEDFVDIDVIINVAPETNISSVNTTNTEISPEVEVEIEPEVNAEASNEIESEIDSESNSESDSESKSKAKAKAKSKSSAEGDGFTPPGQEDKGTVAGKLARLLPGSSKKKTSE